ncbi:hypothetical protein [Sphaerisporangium aureirubrum]|uniref:HNH endonuclease n=1 Tax=Sphaerisporangium aureirubrum TaxID=1544736 RepID=A0ABW1NCP1_9ACTN
MLNAEQRTDRYHRQNGAERLTSRQRRRRDHKIGHHTLAAKAGRQAKSADRAVTRRARKNNYAPQTVRARSAAKAR